MSSTLCSWNVFVRRVRESLAVCDNPCSTTRPSLASTRASVPAQTSTRLSFSPSPIDARASGAAPESFDAVIAAQPAAPLPAPSTISIDLLAQPTSALISVSGSDDISQANWIEMVASPNEAIG